MSLKELLQVWRRHMSQVHLNHDGHGFSLIMIMQGGGGEARLLKIMTAVDKSDGTRDHPTPSLSWSLHRNRSGCLPRTPPEGS